MSKNVAPANDTNEPVDLDAGLTEFERYARDFLPNVSPKSPYYRLVEQQYDTTTWVKFDEIRDKLFPDVPAPIWHSPDAVSHWRMSTPIRSYFVSDDYRVLLRREQGKPVDDGLTCASFGARLAKAPNAVEPFVETWIKCLVRTESDGQQMGYGDGGNIRMTLDEATEIAHLLLLLVDVARDTTTTGGK